MSRRRGQSDQDDSLDLLLDTVSNVFGGVMFLTLLAALLILSRGSSAIADPETEIPDANPIDARLIAIELKQTATALESQKKTLERLDPDGTIAEKTDRLRSIRQTITVARRQLRRADSAAENSQQELEDQQANLADLEDQIEELAEAVAEKSQQVNKIRAQAERTVEFRPLTLSRSNEAVVILRYGRWYLLQEGPFGGNLNRDDFFILETNDWGTSITPKPHRGQAVTEASLESLMKRLKKSFPQKDFHITIAVWDDSFAEFNPLKDSLTKAGYQYRTLTCDSSTRLTNQAAVDPFVQ